MHHGSLPSSAAVSQRIDDPSGSVPPFASLEDSGWGGVVRGWAWTVANQTIARRRGWVKLLAARSRWLGADGCGLLPRAAGCCYQRNAPDRDSGSRY